MSDKKLVELWAAGDHLFGAIIGMPTGVVWSNQTGGIMCSHPECEGIFVPIGTHPDVLDGGEMVDSWGRLDVDECRKFLRDSNLLEIMDVDESCTEHCGEAWVPVVIRIKDPEPMEATMFRAFEGMRGFVTWTNSD